MMKAANDRMHPVAFRCHQALLELMSELPEAELLGELLVLRGAVHAAIRQITEQIQREHPGALT